MRTLCALLAVTVIWNGLAIAAPDRPRLRESSEASAPVDAWARLTLHGRLQFLATCLPGSTGMWLMQVGDQPCRIEFVNEEQKKKAFDLRTQAVTLQGYFKGSRVIVESLELDTRSDPAPGAFVYLRGHLWFPETLLPQDKGLSMNIDGQLYWLHAGSKLQKKAEGLADKVVVVGGKLELRPTNGGVALVVIVTSLRDAVMR